MSFKNRLPDGSGDGQQCLPRSRRYHTCSRADKEQYLERQFHFKYSIGSMFFSLGECKTKPILNLDVFSSVIDIIQSTEIKIV
jgi:hypothetical protein